MKQYTLMDVATMMAMGDTGFGHALRHIPANSIIDPDLRMLWEIAQQIKYRIDCKLSPEFAELREKWKDAID
jgi:hypothetical protein